MLLSDFDYELPPELIARYPLEKRSDSRLLCLNKQNGAIQHRLFSDVLSCVTAKDLIVCNNSKVIPARLLGKKESGGKVEMLIERIVNEQDVIAYVRASKTPKPGTRLVFSDEAHFEVIGRRGELFELRSLANQSVREVIDQVGQIPLPPYFHREPEELDKVRYQTVFADQSGSVAAPTAGLHFDHGLLERLRAQGTQIVFVTLHVGSGTFAPVRVEQIEEHRMHSEYAVVSPDVCEQIKQTKARGGRVIAVGTTAARSLETASITGVTLPFTGETDIFIYPGFQFQCVDALITNFHLPSSTLLMLVAALAGYDHMMAAYRVAVQERYRFFSYGDAMFIV